MLRWIQSPRIMTLLRTAGLGLPLLAPLVVVLSHAYFDQPDEQGWRVAAPLLVFFLAVPLLDFVLGVDRTNAPPRLEHWLARAPLLRLYPPLAAVCVVGLLIWGAAVFVELPPNAALRLGWIACIGSVSGFVGIVAAHELIHRPGRLEPTLGGIVLAFVCYAGFKVEHVYGHHVDVATPRDPSSARRGESVYAFVPRACLGNFRKALSLQRARLGRRGYGFWSYRNELLWLHGLSLSAAAAFFLALGSPGLVFFVGQSLLAVALLEVVNYIEHYGLRRHLETSERYEPVRAQHSWNSSYFLNNLSLFQLQRHSDHHRHASRRYTVLRHVEEAPQLPGGYSAMMLLTLIPPLWRRVIHPLLPSDDTTARSGAR